MELRHLRAFVVVAEELNFRRAAERLQMSQPPLSQQIKRLEHEVGVPLFRRTTRKVELTAGGQAFLREARRALKAADAAPRAAQQAESGQTGTIRLGFTGPSSYSVLLLMARMIRERSPRVHLEPVGSLFTGELIDLLFRDELDAGLIRLPAPAPVAGLQVRELTQHRISAVLPTGHRLADRSTLGIADLADEPLITYPADRGSAMASVIHSAFINHGITPKIRQEGPETQMIMLLAGAGAGVGLVPDAARDLRVPGVLLVPVRDIPPLGLALAWRDGGQNPALCVLTDALDDVAAEMAGGEGV